MEKNPFESTETETLEWCHGGAEQTGAFHQHFAPLSSGLDGWTEGWA